MKFPYPKMWKVRNKTLDQLLEGFIKDSVLRDVLAGLWGYYGLPPSKLSGFYYAMATGEYLKNGSYYIKPNSQALSDALVQVIEASGGKVVYETRAEKILRLTSEKQVVEAHLLLLQAQIEPHFLFNTLSNIRSLLDRNPEEIIKRIMGDWPSRETPDYLKWIRVQEKDEIRLIPMDEIRYFQADDKYTIVITSSGESLIRKPIKELVNELDPGIFWQIHLRQM